MASHLELQKLLFIYIQTHVYSLLDARITYELQIYKYIPQKASINVAVINTYIYNNAIGHSTFQTIQQSVLFIFLR